MATRFIGTPYGAEFPATNFPALTLSNRRPVLAFDASTDEAAYWSFIAPQGITGTITCVVTYAMASATSGAVYWQAAHRESFHLRAAKHIHCSTQFGITVDEFGIRG